MTTAERQSSHFRLGHRPALDGVRGISILVVLFEHGYLFLYGRGGFLGVDIFFVLSGLLITSLLAQEWQETQSISFKKFYSRRALRLLPALFALVIFTSIQTILFPPSSGLFPVFKHLLAVLFYVANWVEGNKVIGHTWSLSIEEQFYIVWPLLFLLLLKLKLGPRRILLILLAGIVLVIIHRAALFYQRYGVIATPYDLRFHFDFRLYTGTDTRCDSLLVGCMAGVLLAWQMLPGSALFLKTLRVIVVISCVIMGLAILFVPVYWSYLYYGGFTLIAFAIASILLFLMLSPGALISRVLQSRVLTWFGRLSYSLYLWHVTVYSLYANNFGPLPIKSYTLRIFIPLAIKFAGSVVVACASYYLLELRFLRMKKRFSSVSSGEPTQQSTLNMIHGRPEESAITA
jgi:peptidoglycan/LPS O-acetylase OafA/YrhL